MKTVIKNCTFPDLSIVRVKVKKVTKTASFVSWTAPQGLFATVWVPNHWLS